MKKQVSVEEWYPIYIIENKHPYEESINANIPNDKLKWINKTFKEFHKVQEYLDLLSEKRWEELHKDLDINE